MRLFTLGSLFLLLGLAQETLAIPVPGEYEDRVREAEAEAYRKLPKARDHLALLPEEDLDRFPYLRKLKKQAETVDFPDFNFWETGQVREHEEMPNTADRTFGPWDRWLMLDGSRFEVVDAFLQITPASWWGNIYIVTYRRANFIPKPGEIERIRVAFQSKDKFPKIKDAVFMEKVRDIKAKAENAYE